MSLKISLEVMSLETMSQEHIASNTYKEVRS